MLLRMHGFGFPDMSRRQSHSRRTVPLANNPPAPSVVGEVC